MVDEADWDSFDCEVERCPDCGREEGDCECGYFYGYNEYF